MCAMNSNDDFIPIYQDPYTLYMHAQYQGFIQNFVFQYLLVNIGSHWR